MTEVLTLLIVVVRARVIVDVVDSFVPMIIDLLDVHLAADQINKSKLLNF